MKWLVLIAFAALAGAWVSYLKRDRKGIVHTGILFGFLTFVVAPWHLIIAPFAIPVWAGYVKGWEVSLLDTLAVGLLLSRPGVGHKTPMLIPLVVYLLASLLSAPLAAFPTYAIAYPIQLLRVILIFIAISRIASYPDGAKSVYVGLVLGLTFQAGLAIFARLGGAIQTGGSFGHQNLLGFATHMVLLPSFALVMGKRWLKWSLLGTIAGAIIVVLTASRATIFIAALGIMITYCVAAAANWNQRKAVFGLVTVLLLGIATPFAASSLERRFEAQGGNGSVFAEDLERTEFENAAKMMIADHPFGVGANHYVFVANTQGYNESAHVTWASTSRSTNVHNGYLLVTAETGYIGLIAFCFLLFATVWFCIRSAFRYKGSPYSELLAGIGCAVIAIAIHCKFEWMIVTFQTQYVLAIIMGIASGCVRQIRFSQRQPRPRLTTEHPAIA